jgi:hypothetical protein
MSRATQWVTTVAAASYVVVVVVVVVVLEHPYFGNYLHVTV